MKLIEAIALRVSGLINDKDNLTAYELAKQAGMPRSTVWKIINPDLTRVKTAKIDTVYQIAATLGMNLKEFFDDAVYGGYNENAYYACMHRVQTAQLRQYEKQKEQSRQNRA